MVRLGKGKVLVWSDALLEATYLDEKFYSKEKAYVLKTVGVNIMNYLAEAP